MGETAKSQIERLLAREERNCVPGNAIGSKLKPYKLGCRRWSESGIPPETCAGGRPETSAASLPAASHSVASAAAELRRLCSDEGAAD